MHHRSLIDPNIPLVADTSVIINLVASGLSEQILSGIKNPIYVVDEIIPELERGSEKGCHDADVLNNLINDRIVTCVSLNDDGWEQFEKLVSGSAKTSLDDGEASTLAYCAIHGAIPIIDEKKANRICKEAYSSLISISSVALFRLAEDSQDITEKHLSDAVFSALINGRMRVMEQHLNWVIDLVGIERASRCTSLPQKSRNFALASL